jgi:hypothetical protein
LATYNSKVSTLKNIIFLFQINKSILMPRRFIQRFKTIDRLIQNKDTGNAIQLAKQLDVSERTAKEFIMVMREHGAPIYFDRLANSYCYSNRGSFNISFIIVQ